MVTNRLHRYSTLNTMIELDRSCLSPALIVSRYVALAISQQLPVRLIFEEGYNVSFSMPCVCLVQ